jgi:hypothetical protein
MAFHKYEKIIGVADKPVPPSSQALYRDHPGGYWIAAEIAGYLSLCIQHNKYDYKNFRYFKRHGLSWVSSPLVLTAINDDV